MNAIHDEMERERVAWEREAKDDIERHAENGAFVRPKADSATAKLGLSNAPLVKQQWDQILTHSEKERLPEVIRDKERQQVMLLLAKRKREEERDAR